MDRMATALITHPKSYYDQGYSGVGMEFFPTGILPDHSEVTLHEVGFLARNRRWFGCQIFSPFWRCYYNFRHGHQIIFPHLRINLGPEAIVLIPDHQIFDCHGMGPAPHFWIHFSVACHLGPRQNVPVVITPSAVEKGFLQSLREMFGQKPPESHRFHIYHNALALLHTLISDRRLAWDLHPPPPGISKARQLMETRYGEPLKLSELAHAASMNVRNFSKAFKHHLHTTASHFLIQVRIREAASRLTHTEQSIDDISDATGFPNRYYFSRVFKKVVGSSPACFRQMHRETAGWSQTGMMSQKQTSPSMRPRLLPSTEKKPH